MQAYRHSGHLLVVLWSLFCSTLAFAGPPAQGDSLVAAAMQGDLATVQTQIASGVDVNVKSTYGYTALMIAAERGNTDIVRALLAAKADVNMGGYALPDLGVGQTALMLAAWRGYPEVVSLLLAAGADVNVRNSMGMTALQAAISKHSGLVINILLKAGARDFDDKAFAAAGRSGNVEAMKVLLNGSVSQSERDKALLLAARFGYGSYIDMVRMLIAAGADIEARDSNNLYDADDPKKINHATPLIWAADSGGVEVTELLLKAGADKEARDYWGHTALWVATHRGWKDVVRLLLDAGAISSTALE